MAHPSFRRRSLGNFRKILGSIRFFHFWSKPSRSGVFKLCWFKCPWRFFGFKIQMCEFTKIWIDQRFKFIEYLIEFIEISRNLSNFLKYWIHWTVAWGPWFVPNSSTLSNKTVTADIQWRLRWTCEIVQDGGLSAAIGKLQSPQCLHSPQIVIFSQDLKVNV